MQDLFSESPFLFRICCDTGQEYNTTERTCDSMLIDQKNSTYLNNEVFDKFPNITSRNFDYAPNISCPEGYRFQRALEPSLRCNDRFMFTEDEGDGVVSVDAPKRETAPDGDFCIKFQQESCSRAVLTRLNI